MTKVHMRL